MKDNEKQIEEMAKVNCEKCNFCDDCDKCKFAWHEDCEKIKIASALYNEGYRKLPENAFILTNDNAEELANLIVTSPQMQSVMSDLIKAWQKEMAEKIICIIKTFSYDKEFTKIITRIISERFGVEIKE